MTTKDYKSSFLRYFMVFGLFITLLVGTNHYPRQK